MTRLEIILIAVSTLSVIGNVFFFVYIRSILARLLFVSEELGDLQNMIDAFAKHVQSVYELEMFYGDQTLQALLDHAVSFNEQLETFEWIYSLTEENNEENNEEQAVYEESTDSQEEAPREET